MNGSLLVRPDARPGSGHGHLARCHALASAWVAAGGRASLHAPAADAVWRRRYAECGIDELDDERPHQWCVVDDYSATLELQSRLRRRHGRLMVIDDHWSLHDYDADLVLDQNVDARPPADLHIETLAGPGFALLRPEFAPFVAPRRVRPLGRTAIICFGGKPAAGTELLALAIESGLARAGVDVSILRDRTDVAAALADADLAVAAAGSTAYELCCVGTPAVLFSVADNQSPISAGLARAGAAIDVGAASTLDDAEIVDRVSQILGDERQRQAMADAGQALVDGQGARRVVEHLSSDIGEEIA